MNPVWLWLVIGLALLAIELLSGTFVLLFFGLGALATATLFLFVNVEWAGQIVFFAALSSLLVLLFRKRFLKPSSPLEIRRALSPDMDAQIILNTRLPAGAEGSISYQGSTWTAVNLEQTDLEDGEKVKIVRTEGVKLFLKRNSPH